MLSAIDNREVTKLTVGAWHEAVGHLDYQLARRALVAARQDASIQYVEPKHIIAHAGFVKKRDEDEARRSVERSTDDKWAPKPNNFEAMAAAWNDPVQFAREVAAYNEQLREAGFPPVYDASERGRYV